MTDTVRTLPELLAIFADNTTAQISPQDMRDFVVSVFPSVLHVDRQVTDAELRDLVANPITLVAAPGAGLFIDIVGCVVVMDTTAGAYTLADITEGPKVSVGFGGGRVNVAFGDAELNHQGFLTGLASFTSTGSENAAMRLTAVTDLTGGDPANTLSLRVYYRIEPAVLF